MKLSKVYRYYKSTQGLYLSDSGGRQVVDKWGDLSLNRGHVEFAGSDRPEFNPLDPAVCVERETTNEVDNPYFDGTLGSNPPTDWLHANHGTGGAVELIESAFSGRQAVRLVTGASERSYITNNKLLADGTYTVSMWLESLSGAYTGSGIVGANISSINYSLSDFKGFDPNGEFPQFVWHTFEKTGSSTNLRIGRGVAVDVGAGEMVFSGVQIEKGSYPTLLTSGTRLAPNAVLEDFLPKTGYVAGWVDAVSDEDNPTYIWSGRDNFGEDGRDLEIRANDRIILRVYGADGGSLTLLVPFLQNLKRNVIGYVGFWDADNLSMYVSDEEGDLYFSTTSHTIIDDSKGSIHLGARGLGDRHSSVCNRSISAGLDSSLTESEAIEILASLSDNLSPEDFTIA